MMIHGYIKKNYSILAAVLYAHRDKDWSTLDAVKWSQENADEAWSLPRPPSSFDTVRGHVDVEYHKDTT